MEKKIGWVEELVEAVMEVDCVEYLEEEEVRLGWIGDLEEEVMVCCEVWRRGR